MSSTDFLGRCDFDYVEVAHKDGTFENFPGQSEALEALENRYGADIWCSGALRIQMATRSGVGVYKPSSSGHDRGVEVAEFYDLRIRKRGQPMWSDSK